MEDWEKEIIVKNIDTLVTTTTCNFRLLASLQASEVLGEDDIDLLMGSESNRGKQVFQLYSTLQKRVNAFEALLAGLQKTNQSGAVAILTKGLEQNGKAIHTLSLSYDVNTVLGNGSYGTVVYKGKFGERDVAVKKVHLSLFGGDQALHEVKLLKDIDAHENVVRYFGAKQNKEFILIALELCEMSLTKWVENNATHETSLEKMEFSCMDVLRQITVGLEWLHSNKIVHRDIKPENVLLLLQMKRAKLSDFGLSRRVMDGNSFVATSNAGGTPGWMAPEILAFVVQMKGTECRFTYSSDVFSLGCVFYFTLTDGKFAFGDPVRCQANILDGKSLIEESEIKHCCTQTLSLNLIQLMISKDTKIRPTCETLVSSPVWSQKSTITAFVPAAVHQTVPSVESEQVGELGSVKNSSKLKDTLSNEEEGSLPNSKLQQKPTPVSSLAQQCTKSENPETGVKETKNPRVPVLSSAVTMKTTNPTLSVHYAKQSATHEYLSDSKQMDLLERSGKLMELLMSKDLSTIQRVLELSGAVSDVKLTDIGDWYGRTMLHYAVERGDYNIVEYLINSQEFETVLSKPKLGNTVIRDCISNINDIETKAYKNKGKILELLFSKQPQLIESKGVYIWESDCTPLHYATKQEFTNGKQLDYIEFLLKHNADVNSTTRTGQTALHNLVRKPVPTNVIKIMGLLFIHGANADVQNKKGYKFWHKTNNQSPSDLYQEILNYLISDGRINLEEQVDLAKEVGQGKNVQEVKQLKEEGRWKKVKRGSVGKFLGKYFESKN